MPMYCMQGLDCGDAAGWLSGLATLLAVWFGLRTARSSAETATRIQKKEHERLDQREIALRHQLAVAFDGDIYILLGQLEFFLRAMEQANESLQMAKVTEVLQSCFPKRGLVIVDKFASDIRVFPPVISGQLLGLLGRWDMMQHGPPVPMNKPLEILSAADSLKNAAEAYVADLIHVKRELRLHILPGTKMTPDDEY